MMRSRNRRDRESDKSSTPSISSRNSERTKPIPRFSLRRIFLAQSPSFRTTRQQKQKNSCESSVSSATEHDNTHWVNPAAVSPPKSPPASDIVAPNARECTLCLSEHSPKNFPEIMTCGHRSCADCLRQYLTVEITESRVIITCPECPQLLHPDDIKRILIADDRLFEKYEDFMVRRFLASDPDSRWCPAPDCGYAVVASGCASCPKLRCEREGCGTFFCYHCKQYWHPNQTCDTARAKRQQMNKLDSITCDDKKKDDIKPCPRCSALIIKMEDGSCNHMTCSMCGAEFCWLCMKEISDLHYLSPSGCTFWGKKPWSRKKKILWQLGTLVGAPLGISLMAGIAVPALVIGIPIWVGKKTYTRYEKSPHHRRNIMVTGAVTMSVLAAPVVAVLAVGIGVPILLAYVYGVVPISLCRSGGCGVTTTDGGGVRFEFDENDANATSGAYMGDNQSVGTGHNVANPSIAPSIGEMSVAMSNSLSASGSHMERMGILRDQESDRESASNRTIAGYSLNGSIYAGAASTLYHKMEVQAEVSSLRNKRTSLSSESANLSIGDKSATISYGDDASIRALAGSISAARDKDSVNAPIIHEDSSKDIAHSSPLATQCHAKPAANNDTDSRCSDENDFGGDRANDVAVATDHECVRKAALSLNRKWSTASAGARLRGDHVKFNISGDAVSIDDDRSPRNRDDERGGTDVETPVDIADNHRVLVHRSFSAGSLSERRSPPNNTPAKEIICAGGCGEGAEVAGCQRRRSCEYAYRHGRISPQLSGATPAAVKMPACP